jgi:hypothetical protein
MSWEAHRWTAKTPTELFHTLGPHGVDELVRQMIATCWRSLADDARNISAGVQRARDVYNRNIGVWKRIKKPGPESFFADLGPTEADHFCRQAMVMTWMMMPRSGGREVTDALKIFGRIFERSIEAWEEDNATFTGKSQKKTAKPAKPAKPAKKKPAGKKGKPKRK